MLESLKQEIKDHRCYIIELEGKIREATNKRIELDNLVAKYNSEKEVCQIQIEHLKQIGSKKKRKKISVTDHAVVRYLERVTGIDMDEIRKVILPDDARKALAKSDSGTFPMGEFSVVMKDRTIVTVIVQSV